MRLPLRHPALSEPWESAKGAVKLVLGMRRPAGRSVFPVFKDDTFLVSYPKSGNTWLRFLLANLLWDDREVTFENIEALVPDVHRKSNRQLFAHPRPRLLKSHQPLDSRYPRTIYVVRDPRSVLVSYAKYRVRLGRLSPESCYDQAATTAFEGGAAVGTWQDHVEGWRAWGERHPQRWLLVRYEDLLQQGLVELRRLMDFLQVALSDETLKKALHASSFDSMRELEQRAGLAWSDAARSENPEIPFVRGGRLAEWKTELPESVLEMVESRCGPAMKALGYEVEQASG